MAELRKLSLHCAFDHLNDTLQDRFVCGLRMTNIQKRLLSETTLSLEKSFRNIHCYGNGSKRCCQITRLEQKQGCQDSTKTILRTFSGEIKPMGIARVKVEYQGQRKHLNLFVVEKVMLTLFGRSWLEKLQFNWKGLRKVMKVGIVDPQKANSHKDNVALDKLLTKYETVFEERIGKVEGMKRNLTFKEDSKPVFCKARTIPFALRPMVEEELDNLEGMDIISKVNTREWATPIVSVVKNGKVLLCGDFNVTLNPQLMVDQYPLPRIEDILASLSEGEQFTKLDLHQAYLHMEMSEESKKYLTTNTHKGLYQFNRLVFGVASAPAVWQHSMEQILQGLPGVHSILDDMIVTGQNVTEHLRNLESVLCQLQKYNLKVNLEKCQFLQDKVEFCGHQTEDKVKANSETPRPQNVMQLRSFIGLVNYYHRFLPDISSTLRPLHQLLKKETKWNWSTSCEQAFSKSKRTCCIQPGSLSPQPS